jgi:DNA cross-link repair 1A protein
MEKSRKRVSLSLRKKSEIKEVVAANENSEKENLELCEISESARGRSEEIILISSSDEEVYEVKKSNDKYGKKKSIVKVKKKTKKIKVTRKDSQQPKIQNYFASSGSNSYFRTHKEAAFPTIIGNDDINISSYLHISLREGDTSISDSQIKPEMEPECISNLLDFDPDKDMNQQLDLLLYNKNTDAEKDKWNLEEDLIAVQSQVSDEEITEDLPAECIEPENSRFVGNKKKGKVVVPKYKIVEGSTFAVDAFRYGEISNVSHYFLTHFHADHYIGLTKKFSHPIFLSKITAFLVLDLIGVDGKWLNVVSIDNPFYINDTKIIPLDANHCPGAVIFLFQFKNGNQILHTGDFRANGEMVESLKRWNCQLEILYLDTTYLHTRRNFPSQELSIDFLLEHTKKFLYDNIGEKYLILCGSYLVGKEKIWLSLAKTFNFKVWMEKERRKAFEAICMASPEYLSDFNLLVDDEEEADIHVVNMNRLTYPVSFSIILHNFKRFIWIHLIESQRVRTGKL